ncbi:MAG TPA: hypothetical protein VM008_18805 [Phycisphaerae bacterium]|nr:hypothetical protein [Phycisphaerae bacterium]
MSKDVGGTRVILDFEEPDPPVAWKEAQAAARNQATSLPATMAAATENATDNGGTLPSNDSATGSIPPPPPTTRPSIPFDPGRSPAISRSSVRPNSGLWALKATLAPGEEGSLFHRFAKPVDMQNYETVSAQVMHLGTAERSGEWRAAIYLVDDEGKRVQGDAYAVTSKWRAAPLDLKTASEEGLDVARVVEIGLQFVRGRAAAGEGEGKEPLEVQTDTWAAESDAHVYIGNKLGKVKTFYVQREGTRLEVGMVGQYEVDFFQRAGTQRPWFTVRQKGDLALGQPGTGLMLLDQDQYDALNEGGGAGVRQDAYAEGFESGGKMPSASWPIGSGGVERSTEWTWECAWTTPVAAIVEVRQEVGPFDALGQAAAELKWRFMIYQWGEVFVHVEWVKGSGANAPSGGPITWALVLDRAESGPKDAVAARLLDAIYPASVHEGLTTALPDRMQKGAAVAMIAKTGGAGRNWWWSAGTAGGGKRVFGVGVTQQNGGGGPLDCMLLVNAPTALMQAGSFSQYLVPPKVKVRQGELDRNFPGDVDNDGLVEPYGFQVIRLANGRTSFTLYPQERPLFYPPYLFTVPAVEREADDVKGSHMLINIDGQQFADPPQFPDGSFLLQMPYVIDRPVQVEGVLVKR